MHAKQKLVDIIAQSKASELFMDSSSNENVVLFCMKNELFSGLYIVQRKQAHTHIYIYVHTVYG